MARCPGVAGAIADLERCLELMPDDPTAGGVRSQEAAIRAELERLRKGAR